MRNSKRRYLEKKVIALYNQKKTNTEIAKEVGVSVKTIYSWLLDYKELEQTTKGNIKALENRLKTMLENPNTPPKDIRDIAQSLEYLESRLKNS